MSLSIPTLLRLAALVLLVAFIVEPQLFEPLFKPLTENNAPAIYNQGSLLSLTLLHLRTVAIATIAAIVVTLVTPFVGALSDAWGRKPVLIGIAALNALLPVALFAAMAHGSPALALLGAVVLAALAGGMSAVGAVATAEQFPGEGRLSGLALGATAATAIFGGLTPYLAQLAIARTGWAPIPGVMIAMVALAVVPVVWRAPETRPRTLPAAHAP